MVVQYQSPVPWLPWVTGYDPTNLNTTQIPSVGHGWRIKYPVSDMAPPLMAEGDEPPN
jgi:hypothetical protein